MAIERRETKSGEKRYEVRYRAADGRERSKTFPILREAQAFERTQRLALADGSWIDPAGSKRTFGDYADEWLTHRRLAPRTRGQYRHQLDKHVLPTFAAVQLGRIRPDDVRKWNTAVRGKSEHVAAQCYRLLRTILATAAEDRLISENPCRIRGAGVERSAERPLLAPEAVLELAETIDRRLRAFVLLAGLGGLRLGELLGLRGAALDLLHGQVKVDAQELDLVGTGRVRTAPKSAAGVRTVTIPAVVVDALRDHLDEFGPVGPDDPVFTGPKGGALRRGTLYGEWDKARAALGLPELHVHDLRHAAGTFAAMTGATQREVMARIGHSSPQAALRYQHAAQERDQLIASRLDDMLTAAKAKSASRAKVVGIGSREPRGMEGPGND